MIKAILFDMGGVVLTGRLEDIIRKVSDNLGVELSAIQTPIKERERELLKGEIRLKELVEKIKKKSNLGLSINQIFDIWNNSYLEVMHINNDLINIVDHLKKNYKLGLISNLSDFHAEINKKRGFLSHFNPCILSCDVGMAKPDKNIFELALIRMKLKPFECIFVDDRNEHLTIASSMGFKTILFTDNKHFLSDLNNLGITV